MDRKFSLILFDYTFAISSGHHFSMTDGFRNLLDTIPNMVGRSYAKHTTSLPYGPKDTLRLLVKCGWIHGLGLVCDLLYRKVEKLSGTTTG